MGRHKSCSFIGENHSDRRAKSISDTTPECGHNEARAMLSSSRWLSTVASAVPAYDILIVGTGLVGSALACSLRASLPEPLILVLSLPC